MACDEKMLANALLQHNHTFVRNMAQNATCNDMTREEVHQHAFTASDRPVNVKAHGNVQLLKCVEFGCLLNAVRVGFFVVWLRIRRGFSGSLQVGVTTWFAES